MAKQIKESLDSNAEYAGKIQDSLRGMETVKSQGLEEYENIKIKILTNSFLNCKWSYSILVCITFSGLETGNSARSLE